MWLVLKIEESMSPGDEAIHRINNDESIIETLTN